MKHAVVAGAGVAGLAAALKLHAAGWTVSVFDAAPEAGPDSFITTKPEAIELCRALGLESELIGVNPDYRRSFIARAGRLHPTPDGFYLLAPTKWLPFVTTPLLSPLGKIRAALDLVLPARTGGGDETLASFVRRRFGQEALDFVVFFSSLQSFSKAAGQSNYAAGCTFKDAFASRLAKASLNVHPAA